MYGGVSLAIYIGGIAKELLSVVRATASGPGGSVAGIPNSELAGAEPVYRRIAQASRAATSFPPLSDVPIVRNVTIDVVSGTSAGGINGIFLAKALANDQSLDPILNLWIEEGDMARLLNDAESARGTRLAPQNPPAALLNGRRMYEKLVDAFDAMDAPDEKPLPKTPPTVRFDAGRVDLFVPTTDIRGEVITLPVRNAVAREKRHRQRFHFLSDPSSGRNEFGNDRNLILGYAARCTSSFPFAFEPFTWNDAKSIAGRDKRADGDAWQSHLMYMGGDYEKRPMGDGGYLDNKPFSYAIDELARRQSHLEVTRTLFYVEPDPERLNAETDDKLQSIKPDAIENALAALISIPGYETIREDLERVVGRNGRVAKLEELEAVVEQFMGKKPAFVNRKEATVAELVEHFGVGYAAYHRVKLDALIDSLADVVCTSTGVGRPEVAQVIRELVTLWIQEAYASEEDQIGLLLNADIDFRLRKIAFVLRKMSASKDEAVMKARETLKECYDHFYRVKRDMREAVGQVVQTLRHAGNALADDKLTAVAALSDTETDKSRSNAVAALLAGTRQALSTTGNDLKDYIDNTMGPAVLEHTRTAKGAVFECAESGTSDVKLLGRYYDGFECYDMVVFPIVQHDGVDEAVRVDVVRISPFDAEVKVKLAGVALGHFGGFLEDEWRRNDIAAGRFNAAEIIIRQLVDDPAAATALVKEAHEAIAAELMPELMKRVARRQMEKSDGMALTPPQQRQFDRATASVINPQKLPALIASGEAYDLDVDRAKQVRSAGRAGVILEQILRSSALKSNLSLPGVLRWGALGGMVLTQIAIPRSFHRTVATYWGRLLALIFAVMAVAGYVTGKSDLQNSGIKGFVVIALIAAVTLLLTRWIGERRFSVIVRLLSWVAVASAIGYGVYAVLHHVPPIGWSMLWTRLPRAVSMLDVFFIGMGIGLLLMSGMLSVIEDFRAAALWMWQTIRHLGGEWK
jgi:patatin-related protein